MKQIVKAFDGLLSVEVNPHNCESYKQAAHKVCKMFKWEVTENVELSVADTIVENVTNLSSVSEYNYPINTDEDVLLNNLIDKGIEHLTEWLLCFTEKDVVWYEHQAHKGTIISLITYEVAESINNKKNSVNEALKEWNLI